MFRIQSLCRGVRRALRHALAGVFLLAMPASGATLTVSNSTTAFDGYHGIADNAGTLLGGAGSGGLVGRMTISDAAVAALVTARNMTDLSAAFVPFDSATGAFGLESLAQGAFEVSLHQDTKTSQNGFGGSSIFLWLYKGASRTEATEYLLVKLNSTFATDPEGGVPAGPDEVYLRPSSGTLFAGFVGPQTHHYNLPGGAAATIFRMMGTGPVPVNQPPVASAGVLAAVAGVGKAGQLVANDAENSPLTYAKTSDPTKGAVVVQSDGSFVYTATAGQTGADSFKFKANDGQADSNEATITITISAPPNQPPVASAGVLAAVAGVGKAGQLVASDAENSSLTFAKTSDPTKGAVLVQSDGSFVYTATVGQTGADSFKFKANDGQADSNEATIAITISAFPNQPPVGLAASFKGAQNDLLTGALQGSDPESSPITFALGTEPVHGLLTMQANGSFSYQPDHLFIGDDSFTFTVNDGQLSSVPVSVVLVVRPPSPGWTWMNGEQASNLNGVYGALEAPAPGNRPGARSLSASAGSGSVLYLFGGLGRGETGVQGLLNDLWRFDATTNEWTWISGGRAINEAGDYGTQGEAAAENGPGGRSGAVLWVDEQGLVWLFGGSGRGSSESATGELNDLWRYDPGANQWAWISGAAVVNANGDYGTLGHSEAGKGPGARTGAAGWRDGAGRLWVFGGKGRGAAGATSGMLNDLWRFDPGTNQWAYCHGSTGINAFGRYGADGVEVIHQGPGGRSGASAWMDADGLMWMFGGQGLAGSGAVGFLNDLWVFNPASGEWRGGVYGAQSSRWRTSPGLEKTNVAGVYGVLGVPSPQNVPPARAGAVASLTGDGKLVLFGGTGAGSFNDVWSFDPVTSNWTWLKGHAKANQAAVYGEKGVGSASNTPGARGGSAGFLSPAGHLWVFGGAAGSKAHSDGWRLRLGSLPGVRIGSVEATGETTADAAGTVSVNVGAGETAVSFEYRAVGSSGAWTALNRPALPPAAGEVAVSGTLTGLQPGTTYAVRIRVSNAAGTAVSLIANVTTQGTAGGAIVAGFAALNSVVDENRGAAKVEVQLSAPAPADLTIPVTFSGSTASDGTDYVIPTGSVLFLPGQTRAWFVVNLVNDGDPEPAETVQLNLGTPSLVSVTLGAPDSHSLQINDDDGPFAVNVASVLAEQGGAGTFTASVNAPGSKRYQWKKAGKKIAGATGASFGFTSAKLTDAGAYSVEVTLSNGVVLVDAADLAVVDTAPRKVLGRAGSAVSLPVSSAGAGLSYSWRKVGDATVLGSASALSLASPVPMDGGDYECTVQMAGVGQLVCPVTLNLVTASPVLMLPRLPDGYVGGSYGFQLEASNLPSGEASTCTVVGLPKGMVASASGRISGVPTAPVVDRAITIVASNPEGDSQIVSLLTIKPLPVAVVGTYGAWFGPVPGMPGGGVGGRVDVSVTPSGSYSASLISGTDSRRAKGPVVVATVDGSSLNIVATFVRKGSPNLVADLTLVGTPGSGQVEVSGSIVETGTGQSGVVAGVKLAPVEAARVGTYTYGLLLDESHEGVLAVPQGDGFGVCKLAATGRATLVGRAADGSAYTAAAVMGREGDMPVFLPVASAGTAGGLAGMAEVRLAPLHNGLEGGLTWTRAVAAGAAKTRSYRAGFGGVAVDLVGGLYQGPASGDIIAGLQNKAGNAKISFENRALIEGTVADLVFTIANAGGVKQKVTILPSDPNPAQISFVLDAKVAGAFNGGFTLPGVTKALNRKAVYQGMFVRLPSGNFFAAGYFLMAQPPEPGVAVGASPELSGQVLVDPVP